MTRPAESNATWKRLGWLVACLCLLVGVAQLWGAKNSLIFGLMLLVLLLGERPLSQDGEVPEQARLAESLRQLAFMTRLGVPLLRALEVLAAHADRAELRRIWSEVGTSVMAGRTLSGALNVHGKVFSRSVIGMVAAGELTGALVQNLEKVSEMLAHEARLKKKVLASLTYPALVLALIVVLTLFTLLVIFPSFAETFRSMNTPLPLVTQVLMAVTGWVTNPVAWLVAVGLTKVGWMQLRSWYARPGSPRQAFAWLLQLPVFGPILRYASLTRYCWAFEGVLSAGVPLLKGVRLVAVASGNPLIEEDKNHLIEALERGESLGDYYWDYRDLYHPMIASMVSVGQESRRLDRIFGHLAAWFHTSLETHLEAMSAIIEPFLLMFVGIVTGTTLVAIFLPLYGTLDRF